MEILWFIMFWSTLSILEIIVAMWSESKLFINFPTTYISRPNIFFKNIAENGCGLFILEVELNALKKLF